MGMCADCSAHVWVCVRGAYASRLLVYHTVPVWSRGALVALGTYGPGWCNGNANGAADPMTCARGFGFGVAGTGPAVTCGAERRHPYGPGGNCVLGLTTDATVPSNGRPRRKQYPGCASAGA